LTPDLLFKILGDKWLRLAVLLLVLAALAHQVSLVIWQLIPAPEQAATQQRTQVARNSTTARAGVNYQQQANAISKAFLFGKAEVEAVVVEVEEAPETQLGYKLRGVYYSPDESLSSAIVEVKPNKSEHYLTQQIRRGESNVQMDGPVLFGEKEGRIALANRKRNPLFLFSALQRQLGYPDTTQPPCRCHMA